MKQFRFAVLALFALTLLLSACGGQAPADTAANTDDSAIVDEQTPAEDTTLDPTAMPEPTSAPEPTAAAATLEAGPQKDVYAVGDTARVDDFLVRVNSITPAASSDYGTPEEGNQFLLVDVTLENSGSEPRDVSALLQMLVQSGGTEYPVSVDASLEFMSLNGSIAPGEPVTGVVGYEVPADAAGAQWVFRGVGTDAGGNLGEQGRAVFDAAQ